MIRLITRGRLTKDFAKGLLAKPEDREPAAPEARAEGTPEQESQPEAWSSQGNP